jgi:hypothetical protein
MIGFRSSLLKGEETRPISRQKEARMWTCWQVGGRGWGGG